MSTILFIFSLLSLIPLSLSISNPDSTPLLFFKLYSDPSNSLSSWSNTTTPCSWLGVTCHPKTQRVTKLTLNNLNLIGSIQPLTFLTHLRHLSLHHNHLTTTTTTTLSLSSWTNLKHLYLSHNKFTGTFPTGISTMRRLRRLDLSYNNFSGEIPFNELAQLSRLITLRLEFNSLSGTLDDVVLPSVTVFSVSDFNVSTNQLAGKIPTWLSNYPLSSFTNNVDLCGKPLPLDCPKPTVVIISSENMKRKKRLSGQMWMVIVGVDVLVVMVVVTLVTCCCYRHRYRERKGEKGREKGERKEGEMVRFEGCKGFDKVDELLKASAEMMGKGGVGATYKVVMEDGDVVVVKRVRGRRDKRREIGGFMREIGGLRHPNVVSLRAYYNSLDELLLVYDFFPSGSLHSLLHGNRGPGRTPLDWTTRLKLASNSAQALNFLHSHPKPKLYHGHLTASNILINHKGHACISDIGLHQLFNNNNHPKFSQKQDVYSFGLVLLEILTGKIVEKESEVSFVNWVRGVFGGEKRWEEVFDFELLSYKEKEGEIMGVLEVALLCLAQLAKDRPNMGDVWKMIEDIGGGGDKKCGLNEVSSCSSLPMSESTAHFTSSN